MSDALYPRFEYSSPPPLVEPGTGELDELLAEIERQGEVLFIPISPGVIRWLLRGEFHRDGAVAKMIGGRIGGRVTGRDFCPYFREEPGQAGPPESGDRE